MTLRLIFIGWIILLWTLPLSAATVYLNTGESLQGKIIQMDDQTLSLESDRGFGVLQIDRADVQLIEFENTQLNFIQKTGFGYFQRSSDFAGALSYKNWFSDDEAVNVVFGFNEFELDNKIQTRSLLLEARYLKVMKREAMHYIYSGASLGLQNVTNKLLDINSGSSPLFSAFAGIEIFLKSIPNLGFSGELGFIVSRTSNSVSRGLFVSGFPSMSVHYYF